MRLKLSPTIVLSTLLGLTGCVTHKDVTSTLPFSSVVGQRFVLNEDCYTYHLDGHVMDVQLGSPKLDGELLRAVNSNSTPKRSGEIIIIGRVLNGSTFVVTKVIHTRTFEISYCRYFAELTIAGAQSRTVDVSPLMDPLKIEPIFLGGIATPKYRE